MSRPSAILTVAQEFWNVAPIEVTVKFDQNVADWTRDSLQITNGNLVVWEEVVDPGNPTDHTSWRVTISPTKQNLRVSVVLPENTVKEIGGLGELNTESNTVEFEYCTIRPRGTIFHDWPNVITQSQLTASVVFDRTVTGLTKNSFLCANCEVLEVTGSGSNYFIILKPNQFGDFSIGIKENEVVDVFGNANVASKEVLSFYDLVDAEERLAACNDNSFGVTGQQLPLDALSLVGIQIPEISVLSEIQSLADCAKNLPEKLIGLGVAKLMELIQKQGGEQLSNQLGKVQSQVSNIQSIVDKIQTSKEDPVSFAADMIGLKKIMNKPAEFTAKGQEIISAYSSKIPNVSELISRIDSLDICRMDNMTPGGVPVQPDCCSPTYMMPPVNPPAQTVINNSFDSTPKNQYDELMFQVREQLERDVSQPQNPERDKMLSIVTSLAMGYHDEIKVSQDASRDAEFKSKFDTAVESELGRNSSWEASTKTTYNEKTMNIGKLISEGSEIIRSFFGRNIVAAGVPVSVGITTYSGPDKDFTTFLDIKPAQRPAELTAYWSKRYNIANQEAKLAARGIKTGTLNYSDAYNGTYGKLISDRTCASTRFPGGSIIQLKRPDGSIYDPTGNNPSGQYEVTDTGNVKLTYMKPDIFTSQPEKYVGMATVQVYLISRGSKTGKQFNLAQSRYGSGTTA